MIKFYKDGDQMGIGTNCQTEEQLTLELSKKLSDLIEDKVFQHDWEFQFGYWLPQIVDLYCKIRGYKNTVRESRWLLAGVGDGAPEVTKEMAVDLDETEKSESEKTLVDEVVSMLTFVHWNKGEDGMYGAVYFSTPDGMFNNFSSDGISHADRFVCFERDGEKVEANVRVALCCIEHGEKIEYAYHPWMMIKHAALVAATCLCGKFRKQKA